MVTDFPILPRTDKYSMNHPAQCYMQIMLFFHLKGETAYIKQYNGLQNHYMKVNLNLIKLKLNDKFEGTAVVDYPLYK